MSNHRRCTSTPPFTAMGLSTHRGTATRAVARVLCGLGLAAALGCRAQATHADLDTPSRSSAPTYPFCCARCEHVTTMGLRCDVCDPLGGEAACTETRVDCGASTRSWNASTGRLVCEDQHGLTIAVRSLPPT